MTSPYLSLVALTLGGLLMAAPVVAQPSSGELRELREAALQSDYAYRFAGRLCNEIGPRLSGSAGAEAAVELVAEEMRALGLKVTLQPVQVPHWVRGEEKGEIVSYPGQRHGLHHKVHLTALGGSSATSTQGLEAEVVVVHSFQELEDLGAARVAGRIVLFDLPFDLRLAHNGQAGRAYGQAASVRVRGPAHAAKLGAAAALVRSAGGANYRLPHTGVTVFEGVSPIPAAAVSSEDAEHIAGLGRCGAVRMHLLLTPRTLPAAPSFNVVGDLEGSEEPDKYVVVSGHLDSWDLGTGALDDAAGVAMAMETAQLFRRLRLRPRRTLRVIAWMNEENGGAGGQAYDRENPTAATSHYAAIESDLGVGHPMGLEVWAPPEFLSRLEPARLALEPVGAGWLRLATGTGADISPLGKKGVPCFHPLVDSRTYFDYHHTAADTFDKIDKALLRENSAVMAVLAYTLTNLP